MNPALFATASLLMSSSEVGPQRPLSHTVLVAPAVLPKPEPPQPSRNRAEMRARLRGTGYFRVKREVEERFLFRYWGR